MLDLDLVRHALGVARQNGYAVVELETGGGSFEARLRPALPRAAAPPDSEPAEAPEAFVRAGLVGFFRPGKRPLEAGSTIKAGDVVGYIAALGIESDVESKVSGEVLEVLVEPDQPVEFGQPIARVRTS